MAAIIRMPNHIEPINITIKNSVAPWNVFAPTWIMVEGFKDGSLSEEEYKKRYLTLMRERYKEIDLLPRLKRWAFCSDSVMQKSKNIEDNIREKLNDNPELLNMFEEYLELSNKLNYYKYKFEMIELKNGKSKTILQKKDMTIDSLKAYLVGMINSLGIYFNNEELKMT